jgi:flagellar basal body rod protein FlgG
VTADGRVTTAGGQPVLDSGRSPLRVPEGTRTVSIDPSGALVVDGERSDSTLLVVGFPRTAGLEKEGAVLLRATPAAGKPVPRDADLATGSVELSNASALESMTTLVGATREFEMLARVVEAFSTVERRAATDIAGTR